MEYNKVLVSEINVQDKVVFLRLDLNVPVVDGKITSRKRIKASIPTVEYLVQNGAKVVILSHLGRVKTIDDVKDGHRSLEAVAREIALEMLPKGATSVTFVNKNTGPNVEQLIHDLQPGGILVLENTRYKDLGTSRHESDKDPELAQYWANLSDVFINDAYGTAHRDHASTSGIAEYQKNNGIGFLMDEELKHMEKAVNDGQAPVVIIFGGAKVSDKLKAVEKCLLIADKVIISGGMAYTFLKAKGYNMGKSNVEDHLLETARDLMAKYPDKIVVSTDFECSPEFADLKPTYRTAEEGLEGMIGLDIGEKSIAEFKDIIATANTILWNGPMGVTEFSNYEHGTQAICEAIAERTKAGAYTVIGGGDSAAAAEKLHMEDSFSWISTGGGATLKFLSGEPLPALIPIRDRIGQEPEKSLELEKAFFGAEAVTSCPNCGSDEHKECCSTSNDECSECSTPEAQTGQEATCPTCGASDHTECANNVRPAYNDQVGVNQDQAVNQTNGWANGTGYSPEPGTSGLGDLPSNQNTWEKPAPEAVTDTQQSTFNPDHGVNQNYDVNQTNGWAGGAGYASEPTWKEADALAKEREVLESAEAESEEADQTVVAESTPEQQAFYEFTDDETSDQVVDDKANEPATKADDHSTPDGDQPIKFISI